MLKDYFLIALKNITRRKLRSWLTIVGIFIGIAAVVSLIGVGEGLRNAITGQFSFFSTDIISISAGASGNGPPGTDVAIPLTKKDRDKIEKVKGLEFAIGRIIDTAKFEYNDKQSIIFAGSLPPGKDAELIRQALSLTLDQGRFFTEADTNAIVIGSNVADEDRWGKDLSLGDKVLIEGKAFRVVGILEKKGSFITDNLLFINEDAHRTLFKRDSDVYDLIVTKLKEGEDAQEVKESIEKLLRKERNVDEGEEDFRVSLPANTIGQINSILLGVQIFVITIAAISLVVGGIGIMNTMYTAVLERTREIGIMKAIGATRGIIFSIYTFESGLIGAVGGIGGATIGFLLAKGLAAIGRLALGSDLFQATISPYLLLGAVFLSFTLGTLFGILPSMQAMRLRPVKALSHRN